MQKQGNKAPHVVMFPLPFQGHINPMLQLAALLHSKGFSITVFHTQLNSPNPSKFPHFIFEPIPDGVTDDQFSKEDPLALLELLNNICQAPFRHRLSQIASTGPHGPIACIITDVLFYFTQAIADDFKLPRVVLSTSSASCAVASRLMKLLSENGSTSLAGGHPNNLVPEIPPLRIKDLPAPGPTPPETSARLGKNIEIATKKASAVIWNTFDGLESTAIEKIRSDFHPTPIYVVGPLHMLSPGSSNSLLAEDLSCMDWLDKQAPGSVIYVSFGSVAHVDTKDLVEIAWGLANSGQPFLWVRRPGLIQGLDQFQMPDGFEEKTEGRGSIVKWAPQLQVLAHPSVGAFWTHNGWNSTLESICEGVPMICSPYLWDQNVNARYVSHVWGTGLQLENGFERGEIEQAIRRLIVDAQGKEMRKRVNDLKDTAIRETRKGGSSHKEADSLSKFIMSF